MSLSMIVAVVGPLLLKSFGAMRFAYYRPTGCALRAFKSVASKAELAKFKAAARATAIKDRRVNIRLSSGDLSDIQTRALEEGVPYQTLIASVLHKYVTGRLAETRENAKPSTSSAAKRRTTSGN